VEPNLLLPSIIVASIHATTAVLVGRLDVLAHAMPEDAPLGSILDRAFDPTGHAGRLQLRQRLPWRLAILRN